MNTDYSSEDFADAPDTMNRHGTQTQEQREKVAMIQTTNTVANPHTVVIKLVHTSVVHFCTPQFTHTCIQYTRFTHIQSNNSQLQNKTDKIVVAVFNIYI